MRRFLFALLALFYSPVFPGEQAIQHYGLTGPESIRFMTYNIRYNNPNDGVHAWPSRKDRVASIIRFHGVDIVGMQEVLKGQIDDLETLLPDYAWFGVGRDDGVDGGEFSPTFYRRNRFELIESGTFWLSESPSIAGSKGWDAAITRIANWGIFRDKFTDGGFLHLNTHFDHRGERARTESARLIVDSLARLADGKPIVVTGDFNVEPTAPAYAIMTELLQDSRGSSATAPHGPEATFAGFTVDLMEEGGRIDYIFVDDSTTVLSYGVISDQWNGLYPSDHLPVLAEVLFRK